MAKFSIKINPGWEQQIKTIKLPESGSKRINRAFQLSFDRVWETLIDTELSNSDFFEDLESGVIGAIFGFTPTMQAKQIEEFKNIFRKKSKLILIGNDVLSEIVIDSGDIRRLRVRHRIRKTGAFIEFRWLEIIINGLAGDHINAKIMDDIGVEEYVASESIFSKNLPSGLTGKSRSGHALMVTPGKSPRVRTLLKRGFTKVAAQVGETFRFRVIPHPFILDEIFGPIQEKLGRLLRQEFAVRLSKLPPIKINKRG